MTVPINLDENFKIALKQLIKEDENANKGLNELSFHFLELVKQNIAYEVHKSMVIGSLTTEFLEVICKRKGSLCCDEFCFYAYGRERYDMTKIKSITALSDLERF